MYIISKLNNNDNYSRSCPSVKTLGFHALRATNSPDVEASRREVANGSDLQAESTAACAEQPIAPITKTTSCRNVATFLKAIASG